MGCICILFKYKNITILKSIGYAKSGTYHIHGQVKNNNNFGVAYVKVKVTCYDNSGSIVVSQWRYTDLIDIDPGGNSFFICKIKDPENKIVNYDVKVVNADRDDYTP